MKISRSEYYYHKNHRTNVYKEDNRKLDVDILRIYNESKKRYGSPKIQQMLEKEGKHVSIKRVGKRMRFLKIKSCIVKKYRPASSSKKVNSEGKENLKELGLRHSYSKKGYPYDNACMESFNAILKKEEVNLKGYETFEEAKMALFEFIEGWYNRKRIHSAINYQIPYEIEKMSA